MEQTQVVHKKAGPSRITSRLVTDGSTLTNDVFISDARE